ncbi:hypothetical protein [Actinoplanes sp. NPDC020271]|uniref:hypothetical protein n=1 Tax=Actinoplanes sp. NPDC020271 TaxID=3363896 RepID=UPI003791C6DF
MPIEPWLVVHGAQLADQALTHLTAAATAAQHEMHMLLEEITDQTTNLMHGCSVNGACHEDLL